EISFCYGQYGKPMLDGTDLSFNMSNSSGYAVFVVTRNRRIGVDIERIRDIADMDNIAQLVFSKSEYNLFRSCPESMKKKMFFECWTRKEALVKAVGKGLSIPMPTFDVSLNSNKQIRLVRLESDKEDSQWTICDLGQNIGYVAAVALEGSLDLQLQTHSFTFHGEEKDDEKKRSSHFFFT
ncbi:4'-phosphopantetheinyl transferase superfamily protein, partial [Candidatus Bathyarchaeota archaeon]|nr:4'-phosphopantetheinyl transferase superfamily protein [Candidatus Bathyarchaeota archaeon]